jgi:hypothetical protein
MTESATTNSFTTVMAKVITIIFHPLLMPLYGLIIVFSAPTLFGYLPFQQKKIILLIITTNNILLPLSLLPYLKWRKVISSWTLNERSERIIPMSLTSFFYFITVYIVIRFNIPLFIKAFILAASLLSFAITVVSYWWKISIHAAGAGAITSLIYILSVKMHTPLTLLLISSIIISGLILSSRLKLNTHNQKEVWIGYLAGIAGMALLLMIL